MAILAGLFAFLGRFLGKGLSTALGWASLMLFGRVPQEKQTLLAGITFGSLAWALAAFGVLAPRIGAYLVSAVPAPSWVETSWLRLAMLVAALLIPIAIGVGSRLLVTPADRPSGRAAVVGVLRGYPFAAVLSFVLIFIACAAVVRRARSLVKRWSDAHVPVVVRPGGYERVARDVEMALEETGLPVERSDAPRVLELPARMLAAVAGRGVRNLVPYRIALLRTASLEVLLYPSDIAISGTAEDLARARAAIASRLTFTAAYLTSSRESQAVEDRIEEAAGVCQGPVPGHRPPDPAHALEVLADVDHSLAVLNVPYDEWEVLYRMRLQVERDLLREHPEANRLASSRVPAAAPALSANGRQAERPDLVGGVLSAGAIALVALDVVLGLADRLQSSSDRGR